MLIMATTATPQESALTESTPRAGVRTWIALAVLMLPVLLVSVDNTVLSFAIPSISLALTPSASELLWIIDVYPLVLAALLVPMGSMADRFGRRRMLLIGSTGFAVVSAFAAFAPSAEALIGYRALLGLFGAMLMPSTLSLIRNLFLHPAQRRRAIAIWAAGFSGGAALGPIVGGFILEHFWWGAVFLMSRARAGPAADPGPHLCAGIQGSAARQDRCVEHSALLRRHGSDDLRHQGNRPVRPLRHQRGPHRGWAWASAPCLSAASCAAPTP